MYVLEGIISVRDGVSYIGETALGEFLSECRDKTSDKLGPVNLGIRTIILDGHMAIMDDNSPSYTDSLFEIIKTSITIKLHEMQIDGDDGLPEYQTMKVSTFIDSQKCDITKFVFDIRDSAGSYFKIALEGEWS